jgi:hypothetical protein
MNEMSMRALHLYVPIILVLASLGGAELRGQLFTDNFESYQTGSVVNWAGGNGPRVVDEATVEAFGRPNQSIIFEGASQKLMTSLEGQVAGQVTTFALDYMEPEGTVATSGLILGFGTNNEINTDNASVRIELRNGEVRHNSVGGLSKFVAKGETQYRKGSAYRLFILVNDTEDIVPDTIDGHDLAADSFSVWRYSDFEGLALVLTATIARDPEYAGFRTWSSFDGEVFIDNVRIDSGIHIDTASVLNCGLLPDRPSILNGSPVSLSYEIGDGLPDGATYEIATDGKVVFLGTESGPAETSGQVEAIVSGGNRDRVAFTLTIRDADNGFLCGATADVLVFNYAEPSEMVQPSIISTQDQLDFMRNAANKSNTVSRAGLEALQATSTASLDYVHRPQEIVTVVPSGTNASENAFRNDSQAARAHALMWVLTGHADHRDKALEILNDWGHVFRDIVSTGSASQTELESAWALPVWLSAADILRYYNDGEAGWDPVDMAAFNHFMEVLYERALLAFRRNNNWGVSASFAAMAYGAWIGDLAVFKDGLANQLLKLENMSEPDGEIEEVCRDTWHPQYSVVTWTDSAELAHHHGRNDLYEVTFDGQAIPRLAIILEYFARLMLGIDQPPCGAGWEYDYAGQYRRFDNYEVPYNHYIRRKAVEYLPVFSTMVEEHWRNDVGADAHFLLWSRLTHGAMVTENPSSGKGVLQEFDADANRWIDTGDWLGWINDIAYPWIYSVGIGTFYISAGPIFNGTWIYVPR